MDCVTVNEEKLGTAAKDIIDASQITRYIYLGSYERGAKSFEGLKVLGITYNLIIGHQDTMPIPFPAQFNYKFVELSDHHKANIDEYFDECIRFIEDAIANNSNILINCYAGVSRSATIVIAYLIKSMCLNYMEAYETVRKGRHWINPNKGFREQLITWANHLGRNNPEHKIMEYEKARLLLKKMYEDKLNFSEDLEISETFASVFGTYHVHTLDVQEELIIIKN